MDIQLVAIWTAIVVGTALLISGAVFMMEKHDNDEWKQAQHRIITNCPGGVNSMDWRAFELTHSENSDGLDEDSGNVATRCLLHK